ncbi:MAG: UpxY family transcription antiterminator [Chitinophagaceae bacterium]
MNSKHWYAIYTRPRWEKKIVEALTRKKIENYCPLNRAVRQWADRKKVVYNPLFTSYVFVRVSELEHLAIKQTYGVLSFVHWLGKPAVIKDEEIDTIKRFLLEYHHIKLEKVRVNVHDKVKITSGPLMMKEGEVLEVRNRSVKVFLPSLGYAMIAEVEKTSVQVLHAFSPQ